MPLPGNALSPGASELESPVCGFHAHAHAGAVMNRAAVEMIPAFERENRQRSLLPWPGSTVGALPEGKLPPSSNIPGALS
jgi:hypothetical protein